MRERERERDAQKILLIASLSESSAVWENLSPVIWRTSHALPWKTFDTLPYTLKTTGIVVKNQKYYRKAVLSHSDVPSTKQAIWVTIEHCSSTDDDPKHRHCPTGVKSHCFYQRAIAKGEPPSSHKENLPIYLKGGCSYQVPVWALDRWWSLVWMPTCQNAERQWVATQRYLDQIVLNMCSSTSSVSTSAWVWPSQTSTWDHVAPGSSSTPLVSRKGKQRLSRASEGISHMWGWQRKVSSDTAKRRRTIICNAMAAEQQRLETEKGGPQYVPGMCQVTRHCNLWSSGLCWAQTVSSFHIFWSKFNFFPQIKSFLDHINL